MLEQNNYSLTSKQATMSNTKKRKVVPVFSCKPNGEMYDVVDGVLVPKLIIKKSYYKTINKKNNGKQN
tara:strand:+ start:7096 stop:7299 length:204 start_codon:yes stop_codon:yes gene_type:complete